MFPSQSRRKPKFLLSLSIKELSNIPKPSGSIYIKWAIKDSTTSTIKGKTPRAHIKDYKAHWNYTSESIVKIGTDRSSGTKELLPKILVLQVYLIPHQHHHHQQHIRTSSQPSQNSTPSQRFPHPPTLSAIEDLIPMSPHKADNEPQYMGKVEINLSEFIQFNGKDLTIRNLLMDSKINAILNIKIGMELIKGNRDDFVIPQVGTYKTKGLISSVLATDSLNGTDSTSVNSPPTSYSTRHPNGSISQRSEGVYKSLIIANDPVVAKLYEKTFEISWDIRPGEYNPVETVEDIFQGGDGWAKNEEGVRLIDLQSDLLDNRVQEVKSKFKLYDKFTTVKEAEIRSDLKSWHVVHL